MVGLCCKGHEKVMLRIQSEIAENLTSFTVTLCHLNYGNLPPMLPGWKSRYPPISRYHTVLFLTKSALIFFQCPFRYFPFSHCRRVTLALWPEWCRNFRTVCVTFVKLVMLGIPEHIVFFHMSPIYSINEHSVPKTADQICPHMSSSRDG